MIDEQFEFQNETLLQAALLGLIRRIPGTSNVQILQGPRELGKDIVFDTKGPLDEPEHCACVVKNTRISGDVSSSSGARTVFHQCEQALDTGYLNGRGDLIRVHRAYVMCPHQMGQSAIESIVGSLQRQPGAVHFICGHELYELFKRHWPDYLVDEATALETYFDDLRADITEASDIEELSRVYDLSQPASSELNVYVPPWLGLAYHSFELSSRLADCVPAPAELDSEWSRSRLEGIYAPLDRAADLIRHLECWDLWPSAADCSTSRALDALGVVRSALDEAWTKAARKKLGWHENRTGTPKLAKDVRLRWDYKGLDGRLDSLRPPLKALDQELASEAARVSGFLGDSDLGPDAVLEDDDLARCMALNQGLLGAPEGFYRVGRRSVLPLGRDLLRETDSSMLVVGRAGYGKTTFCRWNALRDSEEFMTSAGCFIPVYVPLHQVAKGNARSFEALFLRRMGLSALLDEASGVEDGGEGTRIRLYLDGLDEIPDVTRRQEVIEVLREGLRRRHDIQAIVTARDYVTAPWLTWLPRVSLLGLDSEQVRKLGTLWFEGDTAMEEQFFADLEKTPALGVTMSTPLLATITILLFKKTKTLPESRIRLYSTFVGLLCGGWDAAKGVPRASRYGSDVKERILTQLAGSVHRKHAKEFRLDELGRATTMVLAEASPDTVAAVESELLVDGLVSRAGDTYHFSHLSFQEFMAAKSLVGDPSNEFLREAVDSICSGEDWWREVLGFYAGLTGDPDALWRWLEKRLSQNSLRPDGPVGEKLLDIVREGHPTFSPDASSIAVYEYGPEARL